MLLKWVFNLLFFYWVFKVVIQPLFKTTQPPRFRPPDPGPAQPQPPSERIVVKKYGDDEGEYVDYEEVK